MRLALTLLAIIPLLCIGIVLGALVGVAFAVALVVVVVREAR